MEVPAVPITGTAAATAMVAVLVPVVGMTEEEAWAVEAPVAAMAMVATTAARVAGQRGLLQRLPGGTLHNGLPRVAPPDHQTPACLLQQGINASNRHPRNCLRSANGVRRPLAWLAKVRWPAA